MSTACHGLSECKTFKEQEEEVKRLNARVRELENLINNPTTDNFFESDGHDENKTPADCIWLIGYLVGKAVHKPEKRLHHIITTAAALATWHAQAKIIITEPFKLCEHCECRRDHPDGCQCTNDE